jgi:phosphoglycolate phosphatase-like HAD superfamily hydrolase
VRVIAFDFDGTIADTLEALWRIGNQLAPTFGYQPVTPEQFQQLRYLHPREILRRSNIAAWKLPFLLRQIRRELKQEVRSLRLIPGIKEALIALAQLDYRLGIVTSNSQANVEIFLQVHDLADIFSFIDSEPKVLGKANTLRRLLKREQLSQEQVIYVGDEVRDIEAAQQNQIRVIAVTWGFNAPEVLAAQAPDDLVHHPQELVQVVSRW